MNWEYCINHNHKNLTELSNQLEHVSKLEEGEVVDDPAPKKGLSKLARRNRDSMLKILLKAVAKTQVQQVVNHQLKTCSNEMIVILLLK